MIDHELKGKRVLVFGLARSGVGAANLLSSRGARVTITDTKEKEELEEYSKRLDPAVRLHLGGYPESIDSTDMIVVSPGVPLTIEPLERARRQGIRIIGEFELAFHFVNGHVPFLVVTGTNGKTTTTTLLDLMLKRGGFTTILGGNIGTAMTEELRGATRSNPHSARKESVDDGYPLAADYIVAEASSFQLESIVEFKPRSAAIINITPDHMDRYRSIGDYGEAKARVFKNQDEGDSLVLNADDPETMRIERERLRGKRNGPEVFYFSRRREVRGLYIRDEWVYVNLNDALSASTHKRLIHTDQIKIKGVHNMENAMASATMALLAGSHHEAVAETLREFPGLAHRMEFVRELNGVKYINDSKGTNVGAVAKSLEGFRQPIILIAGGRDKDSDFTSLRPLVKERVKKVILIGEAAEKIDRALGDLTGTLRVLSMEEAVHAARDMASRGDVVLLSPACASFDMFRDFEDRGMRFKKIVMGLS